MQNFQPSLVRYHLEVLVVDDDDLMSDVLTVHLEALGCNVACAASAEEALALLARKPVDLLVTDWQMPGMDGMDLVRHVRAGRSEDSYLHVVMFTARNDELVIRRAMEAGVDDFLFKPFEQVQLELALQGAQRNRLLHRRLQRRNSLLEVAHRRTREALDRVRADLDAATALHARLLPAEGLVGALNFRHLYRPAAMLGGDSIGVSPLREGGALFFLIDVCGHGVPAALDSFHLHHRIKQLRPKSPADLVQSLEAINREILDRGDESYATIACGIVRPEREECWMVCAGHPRPLIAIGDEVLIPEVEYGMPVGWFADASWKPTRFAFPPGARLVLYSDGVTECSNSAGEQFGVERLVRTLASNAGKRIRNFVGELERGMLARRSSAGFEDDISLLVIENKILEIQSA
ncbi:PP2C family protein-serine/threonine phosphatase [Novosphingobium pentaromativorans]|uniref:Response regulator receiver modulated serine phosphatase n=1 Tax=Novosphingobium pentaromativorans US6-1 TaxID=1088721 RepID=G6E948_9SPHN|nr:SpoIIE family protein phosphatase [Novosphingobium pentaromativorans]EHJ62272.1 response regulator receiver modulated serine phosphatase [Novosphingobium pentaromativorans US6-1]